MIEKQKRAKLVGEFIRKKREAMGLSQKALGLLFKPPVTTQFISNVERGVTPLPPTHVPLLATALSGTDSEFMALLEKEYALKLNGRLGKAEDLLQEGSEKLSLLVANTDFNFMKSLYDAYQDADSNSRQAFVAMCESILKVNNSR